MPEDRRLGAVMFTDIVGYTALMGRDEDKAYAMLAENLRIHKLLIEKYNGHLIKEIGDGVLASFTLASDAVRCAMDIQKETKANGIPLKIGIHEGELVLAGEDVLGDVVNIASRLEESTAPGCISISSTVYQDIKNKSGINTKYIQEKRFKNVDEPIKVYHVFCEDTPAKKQNLLEKLAGHKKTIVLVSGIFIIAILSVYLIFSFLSSQKDNRPEKSILVLPFHNESSDKENEYFVNGMMEQIVNNLSKVADLTVKSRTTSEKYRVTRLSAAEIAEKENVRYILEGSVQKIDNQVMIHVQLIKTRSHIEGHVWGDSYRRNLSNVFDTQSEIAQTITKKMFASLTPKEKDIIETVPTKNMSAYDLYLRGHEEFMEAYKMNADWNKQTLMAIDYFKRAIQSDSTFAQAYSSLGIAMAHYYQNIPDTDVSDTLLLLAKKALSLNNRLEEGYQLMANYFVFKNNPEQARVELNKILEINPNYSNAYFLIGFGELYFFGNRYEAIKNLTKAIYLDHTNTRPWVFRNLGHAYYELGFEKQSIYYFNKAFELENDTTSRYEGLHEIYLNLGDYKKTMDIGLKCLERNPGNGYIYWYMIMCNSMLRNDNEAYNYILKGLKNTGHCDSRSLFFSYTLWQVDRKKEAKKFFDAQLTERLKRIKENNNINDLWPWLGYFDIAAINAVLGNYDQCFEYLENWKKKKFFRTYDINLLRYCPLLDNIRNDERFKKVLKYAEETNQREHERVEAWLKDNKML